MTGRCRHRASWFIANGHYEWCYRCGALRSLDQVTESAFVPTTQWQRPVGPTRPNPFPMKPLRREPTSGYTRMTPERST
jgi:hypothetical protein